MQPSMPNCPRCGRPLTYVYQYQQWYCPSEGVYPWAMAPQAQPVQAQGPTTPQPGETSQTAQPAGQPAVQTNPCPRCGQALTYAYQYRRWYCPAEGVYPWG